jgi:hypothetical protein
MCSKRLDVKLSMDDLASLRGIAEEGLTSAKSDLNLIMKIKYKSGFKLDLELQQQRIPLNLWPRAFESCRTVWEVFINEGAHVRIYWCYSDTHAPQIE